MLIDEKRIWTPDNSYLLEYRERAESGEIVIGQELRQELENLKEDFYNDRYFYDTTDARLRMDFMENCVRLTKSPYYNKPIQNVCDWIRPFQKNPSFNRKKKHKK